MMLPRGVDNLEHRIGFSQSAGAVVIALESLKKAGIDFNWEFKWYFPECSEPLAVGYATKLILDDKVDVIIGPPCSLGEVYFKKLF